MKIIPTLRIEQNINVIEELNWSDFVSKYYGRPYRFQQQDGCRSRGMYRFSLPADENDFTNDTIPENVNDPKMGVSFAAWLKRDPKQNLNQEYKATFFCLDLWWKRNFYPNISMIINDLYKKEILKDGEYLIVIDW